MRTKDAALAQQAVELLQSDPWQMRIEVKPEAVSMTDFAALRSERTEILASLSGYMQAVAPLLQQMPSATPLILEVGQWVFAGLRGSSQIEGVFDAAIAQAKQAQEQAQSMPQQAPPPDPKLQAQAMKGQQDLARVQADLDADITREQVKVQADNQRELNQAAANTKEALDKARIQQMFRPQTPSPLGGNGGLSR